MPVLLPEERIGTTIAEKYRIDSILGAGGMGVVFAGHHEWTGRDVAVKLLKSDYAQFDEAIHRFMREARAAARLQTPHVVDVLDMGREPDGTVYMVLERLRGEPLSDRLSREGQLELPEAVATLKPVMQALVEAHRVGIVHRDLKPDNIFLALGPDDEVIPKLLDFGIAKVTEASKNTTTGTMLGTPHYMSPEQVKGESNVGPAADIWSMGVVLYECLSGALPYPGESSTGVLTSILISPPHRLDSVNPDLPSNAVALVHSALQHRVEDRPQSMEAFLQRALELVDPAALVGVLKPPPIDGAAATEYRRETPIAEVVSRSASKSPVAPEPEPRSLSAAFEAAAAGVPEVDAVAATASSPGVGTGPLEVPATSPAPPSAAQASENDSQGAKPFPLRAAAPSSYSQVVSPPMQSRTPLVVGGAVLALLIGALGAWAALPDGETPEVGEVPAEETTPAAAPAPDPAVEAVPPSREALIPRGVDPNAVLVEPEPAPAPAEPEPTAAPAEPEPIQPHARRRRSPRPQPPRPQEPAPATTTTTVSSSPSPSPMAPPPQEEPAVGANNAPILEIE